MTDNKLFLDQDEAVSFLAELGLPLKPSTLATKACRGDGPPFRRFGKRRLYTPEDLRSWAHEATGPAVRSATEARAKKAAKAAGDRQPRVVEEGEAAR